MKASKLISFIKQCFFASAFILPSLNLQAELYDRGNGMIYDSTQNITWLQDANFVKTSGYDADGKLTWDEAKQWADNLVYGGFSDWRLPSAKLNGTGHPYPCVHLNFDSCPGYYNGANDVSYNNSRSEIGHLFLELGNKSAYDATGIFSPWFGLWVKCATVCFNVDSTDYWEADLYVGTPYVFLFSAGFGKQTFGSKTNTVGGGWAPAWVVRDGDVTSPQPPSDFDNDGILDSIDNCGSLINPDQKETDGDGIGDSCDPNDDNDKFSDAQELGCASDLLDASSYCSDSYFDSDSDAILDSVDNCSAFANFDQLNTDADYQGNACDTNDDNDVNSDDEEFACGSNPLDASSVCETDGDGFWGVHDNCPSVYNPYPLNTDGDTQGDACDADDDNDGQSDVEEISCSSNPVDAQDMCNSHLDNPILLDDDSDGVENDLDNCPLISNVNQADSDHDGMGDVCDSVIDKDNNGLDDVSEISDIQTRIDSIQLAMNNLAVGKEASVNQYMELLDSASDNADLADDVNASIQSANSDIANKLAYYAQRKAEGASSAELKTIKNEQNVLKKQVKSLQKSQKNYLKVEKKLLNQAAKLVKKNKLSGEVTSLVSQIQEQQNLLDAKKAEVSTL